MLNKYVIRMPLIATLLLTALTAQGETINYQVPACLSEDTLKEFGMYIVKNDEYGMMQLIESGMCTILSEGDVVSVIKRGFMTSTIRFKGFKLFTDTEALGD